MGYKQDQMEKSAEDALLCVQSSTGCPEQLGLFRKTHGRHGVNSIPELELMGNSGIGEQNGIRIDKFDLELTKWN